MKRTSMGTGPEDFALEATICEIPIPPALELPGPYDEEKIDTFEAGFKISTNIGILNGAVFYNLIDDVQRVITLGASPTRPSEA